MAPMLLVKGGFRISRSDVCNQAGRVCNLTDGEAFSRLRPGPKVGGGGAFSHTTYIAHPSILQRTPNGGLLDIEVGYRLSYWWRATFRSPIRYMLAETIPIFRKRFPKTPLYRKNGGGGGWGLEIWLPHSTLPGIAWAISR